MPLLRYPIDRLLVEAGMNVIRAIESLEKIDLRRVPVERREAIRQALAALRDVRNDMPRVRTGRSRAPHASIKDLQTTAAKLEEALQHKAPGP